MRRLAGVLLALAVALSAGALVLALLGARDAALVAAERAMGAERSAARAARRTTGAAELVASCESQARAELDAAHARIYALEVSLRAVAAGNPCRVRLPRPIVDAPRPLWCEDRTSWWAKPLPTQGALCYPPAARDPGWFGLDVTKRRE